MYFQLQVDYYSSEANKNKHTNFYCTGQCTCNKNLSYFVGWT